MKTFRLPDATRVSHLRLRTRDLGNILGFYERVMGLQIVSRSPFEGSLSATGDAPAFLTFAEDRQAAPRSPRTTGLYHLALRYPTPRAMAQAVQRISLARWPISGGSQHSLGASVYLDDADGNGIELYYDLPRSKWPMRDGRIVMSRPEPLDFERLLSLADRESVPAHAAPETDIGHFNLHVGDLDEARRFFSDFFGLEVMAHIGPAGLFLSAGGYHHHVAVNTWAGKTPAAPNATGLISYRFAVPETELLDQLTERALTFGFEARRQDGLVVIRDMNGNALEVEVEPANAPATRELSSATSSSKSSDHASV